MQYILKISIKYNCNLSEFSFQRFFLHILVHTRIFIKYIWRELNVFIVFGYGRVHLVLRLRSSKAEPAKAESQFKLVRSDRKEQQEAQDTLKKPARPPYKEGF